MNGRASVLVLLAAALGALIGAAVVSAGPHRSGIPIATVTRQGGFCISPAACRSVLRIDDVSISGDRFVSRRLKPAERAALLRAIAKLDVRYFRAHPFTGTCPTAYDGAESIYRFRGFPRTLPGCTYDLSGVEAVRLVERLLATLKPTQR